MSASSHTRGHRYAPEYTAAVLEWLELYDRRLVNSANSLSLELSKMKQYHYLKKFNIRVPQTIAVSGASTKEIQENLYQAAEKYFSEDQFITKHNRAGKGLGVKLFDHYEELTDYFESEEYDDPVDGVFLLQQYIYNPEQYIVRAEFVGGKFVYAVRVSTGGGFELCPADVCDDVSNQSQQLFDFSHCAGDGSKKVDKFSIIKDYQSEDIAKYIEFLRGVNVEVSGIESITDENGIAYTYDVNVNTNYNGEAEKKHFNTENPEGGMYHIAAFLGQELKKL
eukprot:TRINITY_DN2828_c0_g1_i4.p1 TRINITY_DN2828_c0_g1~~TRINITY_DN2828_c0_g1_i4.p1  ORF type:complete len:280 (-),score=80.19 TRINITY_DN2828_c0_g1_i4:117-956(-)